MGIASSAIDDSVFDNTERMIVGTVSNDAGVVVIVFKVVGAKQILG